MATILEFPSQQVQGFSFLESRLRELLESRGADEELVEFASSTVRDIYQNALEGENYSFSLTLPDGVPDGAAEQLRGQLEQALEALREENHAVMIRLVAELALAHVKIFQYERLLED